MIIPSYSYYQKAPKTADESVDVTDGKTVQPPQPAQAIQSTKQATQTESTTSTENTQAEQTGSSSDKNASTNDTSTSPAQSTQAAPSDPSDSLAVLERRKRNAESDSDSGSTFAETKVAELESANKNLKNLMQGAPENLNFTHPHSFGSDDDKSQFYADRKEFNKARIAEYWNSPLTINGVTRPRAEHAVELEKTKLARQADVAVLDSQITLLDRDRIDRLRTNPSESDRSGQSGMPGVYSISGTPASGGSKTDFSGMYIITERPAADNVLKPESNVGATMLVIPGQPIKKFESMQALNTWFKGQLDDPKQRDSLLKFVDEDKRAGISGGGVTLDYAEIKENVFENRLASQIKQQENEAGNLLAEVSDGKIPPEEAEKRWQAKADNIRTNSDLTQYLNDRSDQKQDRKNIEILKDAMPKWLKEPPPPPSGATDYYKGVLKENWRIEREKYLNLAKVATENQIKGAESTADIKTLDQFTEEKAKAYLAKNGYPDADVYHYTVQIDSTSSQVVGSPNGQTGGKPVTTTTTETKPLLSYLKENNPPHNPGVITKISAYIRRPGGNESAGFDVKKMANDLNIGQTYQDYLKNEFISSSPSAIKRREAMKQADRAVFEKDISQAKLQGNIGNTDDLRGINWANEVLQHPDPGYRSKVDGYEIEVSRLKIAGEPVSNVYTIGPTDKNAMKTVLLYTPGAPDGKTLREFRDRTELAKALESDDMKDYLSKRVDPGARGTVRRELEKPGGAAISEEPIKGNFFDAMYEDHVNRTIVKADRATTSNAEVGKQTVWNIYNWGLDAVSVIPGIGLPVDLGQAGVSFFASAEAANSGDTNKANAYLFEGITRIASAGSNAPSALPSKYNGKVPVIKSEQAPNGDKTYNVSPNPRHIPPSYAIEKPANLRDAGRGVYKQYTEDGQTHKYVEIDGQFYHSGQNGQGRYIQHPTSPTDRIQIERVGDKWQMAAPSSPKKTERPTLNGLNDWLKSSGEFNKDSLGKNSSMIYDVLSEEKNSEPFKRLLDIQVQQNIFIKRERDAILSESDPGKRGLKYLDYLSRRSEDQLSQFPDQLKQAIENGEVAKNAKKYVSDLDEKSKQELIDFSKRLPGEGKFGKDALTKNYADIGKFFSGPANQEELKRLLDIQVQQNIFIKRERDAILSESDPGKRGLKYLDYLSRRSEDQLSRFPDQLKQAIENGEVAKNAKKYVSDLDEKSKQELIDFSDRLRDGDPFDKGALIENYENIGKSFSAPGNQDVLMRLLAIQYSKNIFSRGEIEAIWSEPDPGKRGMKYLDYLSRRSDDQLSQFPSQLAQAIDNG